MIGPNLVYISLCLDCPNKLNKFTVFSCGSFRHVYRVTDEDSITETAVFFNIITALKGTHF